MEELEDVFKTEWFKNLPWLKRVWIRLQVAVMVMLSHM